MKTKLLITSIIFLALVLRLPFINGSFWLDEAAQAIESARPLSQQLDIVADFQPPLLHLLLHFAMYFGKQEWWLRTVGALIPGLVSIWATYQLGKKIGNKHTAVWASLLLATNSLHIFFSQELRPYALPAMLASLSWLILANWQTQTKNQTLSLGLITMLGVYSSFLYPFVVLGQFVWLTIKRQFNYSSRFSWALILGSGSFLAWWPIFRQQLAAGGAVRQNLPGWDKVVSFSQLKSLPLVAGKFIFGVVDLEPSFWFVAVTLALSCLLCTWLWQTWQQRTYQQNSWLLLACWLIVPTVTAWLVSFWIPVIQPKRVLFLLPAMYLILALPKPTWQPKWLQSVLLTSLLLLNLLGTFQYYTQPKLQRENWRSLHQQILSKYAQNSLAVFAFDGPFAPWRWYDNNSDYPTLSLGVLAVADVPDLSNKLKTVTEYQYVLVFDYLRTLSDPNDKILHTIANFGYVPVEFIDYPNIGLVRVYARPSQLLGQQLL